MKIRKISLYKLSGGRLSLEKEGKIADTNPDAAEQDSMNLDGLDNLITDMGVHDTIIILITDDTDTPKYDEIDGSPEKILKESGMLDPNYKGFL